MAAVSIRHKVDGRSGAIKACLLMATTRYTERASWTLFCTLRGFLVHMQRMLSLLRLALADHPHAYKLVSYIDAGHDDSRAPSTRLKCYS